jgi:hypothetical protein
VAKSAAAAEEGQELPASDTVGAVCLDRHGLVAAGEASTSVPSSSPTFVFPLQPHPAAASY